MDPELKAYLDAMRQAIVDDLRTELGAQIDAVAHGVRAVADGHDTLRRQIDDGFREHDRRWDERVQPVEAVVRTNSRDLQAIRNDVTDIRRSVHSHEQRVEALERQQGRR